ncbi:MAG: 16S rRNA (guanine(527)-N(7))-methyltransferase RsmG [Phycisphaerae bacterium]|nr:16S rRNA (guanine(527)-N(7))-methyltransferase RsmG [Phycisphaerae bacterium]
MPNSQPAQGPPPAATPEPAAPPAEFLAAAAALGIEFETDDVPRLAAFVGHLLAANRTMNLTAIRDPNEAWRRHILDALTLVPLIAEAGESPSVIDVGSGCGVPGLPLAVVLPHSTFTLVEATGKKALFLRDAAARLGLSNVRVENERAERLGHDRERHRERYDVAVARAVGHLAIVAELTLPLVRRDGWALAVKGEKAEHEVSEAGEAIGMLGGRVEGIADTPTGRVVVMRKGSLTPRVYPRSPGEPAAHPLGMRNTRSTRRGRTDRR